jgi:branched-chain amino acid transport system permease protein
MTEDNQTETTSTEAEPWTLMGFDLKSYWTLFGVVAIVLFLAVPLVGNPYHLQIAFLMLVWGGLALSWNILGGYTGYVSFGHGAFFALGAFTIGLGQQYYDLAQGFNVELLGMFVLAGIVPMVIASIIALPILRLSGGYFAIAMLGFQIALGEAFTAFGFLGGGRGVPVAISDAPVLNANQLLYYLLGIVVLITLLVANAIRRSEFGYGLLAIRENQEAAESIAIPTTRYKVGAFAVSAFFPGVLGAFYAFHLTYFTAASMFDILITLNMIVYAVVGGLGTVVGPFIGAAVMIFVKNFVLIGASEAHVFFTGLFVVVVMLFFPGGIVGTAKDYQEGKISLDTIFRRD